MNVMRVMGSRLDWGLGVTCLNEAVMQWRSARLLSFTPSGAPARPSGAGEPRSARRLNAQPPMIIRLQAWTRRRDPDPAGTHLAEGAVVSVPERHHGYLLRGRSSPPLLPALPAGGGSGAGP